MYIHNCTIFNSDIVKPKKQYSYFKICISVANFNYNGILEENEGNNYGDYRLQNGPGSV